MTKRQPQPPVLARDRRAASHSDAAAIARGAIFPSLSEILDPRGPFLVPVLLLLASRLALWALLPLASEDAYITYRYARNLAAGHGLVFNPDQRVMGFTSLPWTLWNALGIRLINDPVAWSRASVLLADLASLLVLGNLVARYASRTAASCFTLFFAAWPYFAAVAVSGMENGVLVTWTALGAALIARRSRWSSLVLVILALWRPEGLAVAAVLLLYAGARERIIVTIAVAAVMAALAWYFGSPVPHSLTAKAQLYGTPGPWAGRHWWEWLVPFPMGRWPGVSETNLMLPLSLLFIPAVVAGGLALWRMRSTPLAAACAGLLAVWIGYSLTGTTYFFWYMVVPLSGLSLVAAVGLPRVIVGRLPYITCALFVVGVWWVAPALYIGRAQSEYLGFAAAGRYLREHARPGDRAMLEPIGIVGYTAPVEVIDEVGLISPAVLKRRLAGAGWYTDIAGSERPQWLVVRRGVLASGTSFAGAGTPFRSTEERDSLLARYTLETEIDRASGDNALLIFRSTR